MTIVNCRDCGHPGEEDPNDPAPALCPKCYEARLNQITPRFMLMCDSLQHPGLIFAWLEEALIDIGGELPEYAHHHARELLWRAANLAIHE